MLNLKILSVICGIELVGAIGNVMGVVAANEILLGGTCLLAGYTVYLGTENFQKKTCPECKSKIRKAYRICPECGHLFQKGLSEEQLTDVIEKEKEDDMSSEQIDRVFEKVDTLSIEEIKAYDSELDDFLRK
ncbi:zinc ribbon domain-containing protein [Ruminococcus sp. 1001136sp1]|uniref:zinc ribbon domain-containing protein n=1 Tax=Ruminococcus sp. 1001136sp1 TaxID=2986996 RepID=UPI0032198179